MVFWLVVLAAAESLTQVMKSEATRVVFGEYPCLHSSGPKMVLRVHQAALRFSDSVGVLFALINFAATAVMTAFTNT